MRSHATALGPHTTMARHQAREGPDALYPGAFVCPVVKGSSATIAILWALPVGLISAYFGGLFDRSLTRVAGTFSLSFNRDFTAIFRPARREGGEAAIYTEDAREFFRLKKIGRRFGVFQIDGTDYVMCAECCQALVSDPWFMDA